MASGLSAIQAIESGTANFVEIISIDNYLQTKSTIMSCNSFLIQGGKKELDNKDISVFLDHLCVRPRIKIYTCAHKGIDLCPRCNSNKSAISISISYSFQIASNLGTATCSLADFQSETLSAIEAITGCRTYSFVQSIDLNCISFCSQFYGSTVKACDLILEFCSIIQKAVNLHCQSFSKPKFIIYLAEDEAFEKTSQLRNHEFQLQNDRPILVLDHFPNSSIYVFLNCIYFAMQKSTKNLDKSV